MLINGILAYVLGDTGYVSQNKTFDLLNIWADMPSSGRWILLIVMYYLEFTPESYELILSFYYLLGHSLCGSSHLFSHWLMILEHCQLGSSPLFSHWLILARPLPPWLLPSLLPLADTC
jgi:hypothetical protein